MNKTINCKKRIYTGYQEYERAKKQGFKILQCFGKYQYIYSSKKGEISLVHLVYYYHCWEIYSLEGNLFKDVERFSTKKEAEKKIETYLI